MADTCRCKGHGCVECLAPLPKLATCSDCIHFDRFCQSIISRKGDEKACDWIPSRFLMKRGTLSEASNG